MRVLVTGGAGFLGSHQIVALTEAGHDVFVVDDFSNSSPLVLSRVERLIGTPVAFQRASINDRGALDAVFRSYRPEAILHFAAMKHVHESIARPLDYYRVNVSGLITLLDVARAHDVYRVVYSSSGSVYGESEPFPIPETAGLRPTNPYARSKVEGETILQDLCASSSSWRITALRYFNPAGAHPSGIIGEDPTGLLSNLVPVLMHAAVGNLREVSIFGTDYDTPDGTAVRDYVHVLDVAEAHVRALDHQHDAEPGFRVFNVGRGVGVSVLELIDVVERVTGRTLATQNAPRRAGDVGFLVGETTEAASQLGLDRYRDLEQICHDAWCWQSRAREAS